MRLIDRAQATEQALAKFRDEPFDWEKANCIKLAYAQAKAMGHDVPKVPKFKNALGAKRALKREGVDSVTALLDKHFIRHVAPAFMLIGDLCTVAGHDGMEAVFIADGQGNLLGWHEHQPDKLAVVKFAQSDIIAAWRL